MDSRQWERRYFMAILELVLYRRLRGGEARNPMMGFRLNELFADSPLDLHLEHVLARPSM